MKAIDSIKHYFNTTVWIENPKEKRFLDATWIKLVRTVMLGYEGFEKDLCSLRASALTFFSILSFVPVLALLFGLAKGFGLQETLKAKMLESYPQHQDIWIQVFAFSDNMLDNTKGGLIAGVGVLMLFWSAMKVMENIESSFNDIWKVKTGRTIYRKFTDYLSIFLIAPFLLVASGGATIFLQTTLEGVIAKIGILGPVVPLIHFAFGFIPYTLIWIVFTFLFKVMPNTQVNFKSALVGGILAGTAFQVTEYFFFAFQIGVSKYNAIYGSFAALPLFLGWLQTSWLIILLGCEISYVTQNLDLKPSRVSLPKVNYFHFKLICVWVLKRIGQAFKGNTPITLASLSKEGKIPLQLLQQVIAELEKSSLILVHTTDNTADDEVLLLPAKDPYSITMQQCIERLETQQDDFKFGNPENWAAMREELEKNYSTNEAGNLAMSWADYSGK